MSGAPLGVPSILGLYWGPPISGNYHMNVIQYWGLRCLGFMELGFRASCDLKFRETVAGATIFMKYYTALSRPPPARPQEPQNRSTPKGH